MPLFKRKNNPTIAEIESYYEQQNRRSNSPGRAWTMAILAVIFTLAILAGLFFGGRWLYGTLTDSNTTETTQNDVNTGTVDIDGFDSESSPSNGSTSADTSSNDEGRVSDEAASTNESNIDRIAGSNTDESDETLTTTGPSSIPNTGPGETALVLALLAGLIATTFSYRKKLQ